MKNATAQRVTSFNNEGARCLTMRKFEEAIKYFEYGLKMLRQILSSEQGSNGGDGFDIASPLMESSFVDEFTETSDRLNARKPNSNSNKFVFHKPIHMTPKAVDDTHTEYLVQQSYVLLYNSALAYHLQALGDKSPRARVAFQKALHYYEIAASVVVDECFELNCLQNIALLNNTAQVHRSLDHTEMSENVLQSLLSNLMVIVDFRQANRIDMLDGFIGNIMHLILNKNSAPSA